MASGTKRIAKIHLLEKINRGCRIVLLTEKLTIGLNVRYSKGINPLHKYPQKNVEK